MKTFLLPVILLLIGLGASAQSSSSSASAVRRTSRTPAGATQQAATPGVSQRMQAHMDDTTGADDSEMQWMRVIYRSLDLDKAPNGSLYYPDEPVAGQDNMFRIIMKRMADGSLPAYEYLDGREIFTDEYRVKMRDILDRYYIPYTDAKGSTEKNPRFVIEEADIPSSEVLSYYIIEKWEFDRRSNRMRTRVEAICPVLHRAGDFGTEAVKYPMFWIRYNDLRPFIATASVFTDDDNNLASHTLDDFFTLGLYKGDIYKTRNMRNKSLMQLYPDPDDLAHARDSIQQRLDNYEKKLWVPSLEELAARRDSTAVTSESAQKEPAKRVTRSSRGVKKSSAKPAKVKKPRQTATRSVRARKK